MKTLITTLLITLAFTSAVFACETSDLLSVSGPDNIILVTRPTTQLSWAPDDSIFRIHYDTEGANAVYRPEEDINPVDGIPDYVNRVADYLAVSYNVYNNDLQFDLPPSDGNEGGDSLYDIYITEVPALTSPESPSEQYPGREAYTSFIQLGHDLRTPLNPDDPLPFLKVSVAHEYFHAVQFAYRAYSQDPTTWWFEACAGWAEELVFDDINFVHLKLESYLPVLHKSLYQTGGLYKYGAYLFPQFLSSKLGVDFIKECWEKFASFSFAIDAINYAMEDRAFEFNENYVVHAIWNYFTGENYRPGFYSDGSMFGSSAFVAARHSQFPLGWTEQPIESENLSSSYIVFQYISENIGKLTIEYRNTSEHQHMVAVVMIGVNGEIQYDIYNAASNETIAMIIDNFSDIESVVMIPVWVYEGIALEGITSFTYRAYLGSPTFIDEDVLEPAALSINSVYPNPFNGNVILSFASKTDSNYKIKIYDINGRLIHKDNGRTIIGNNQYNWEPGFKVSSGPKFYRISQSDNVLHGKMIYLK